MLKLDSIADAWAYYLEGMPDKFSPEKLEKLRMVFYDSFGIALHFWLETHGAPDTLHILQREYLTNLLPKETKCAKD